MCGRGRAVRARFLLVSPGPIVTYSRHSHMPADSSRAVFLSYASQDADVARRLCEALRAVGIEVWFDQSELVMAGPAGSVHRPEQLGSSRHFERIKYFQARSPK